MDESEFDGLAAAALQRIEDALEQIDDIEFEVRPGGVIEIEFEDGAVMIINRHGAAREIWVADKSGGFHYRPQAGAWINTRDGEDLFAALGRLIGAHVGRAVKLV
ncbi:MAG: iron donor protein CyaY [Rhodocyclaceae bacterium]|nr:iron donor protein CyaY [Rhodocyclaceae bacterium]MBX3670407.1 iron donor protein CyaY [Rhodocyclaceae bacterium]